jgi:glucose/mannose transport system substrate-binding protein
MRTLRLGLAAGILSAAGIGAAGATEIVVHHDLASPAELSAVKVLKDAFEAGGDKWKDLAIPHDSGATISLANLVAGGNPPNVFFSPDPGLYRDLAKQGKELSLDGFYSSGKGGDAFQHMPKFLQDLTVVDGVKVRAPNSIHIDGTVCYNKAVAVDSGIDPTSWKSMDAFYADFDKIKAKGYIPLAFGADSFQIGYLFHALVAAVSGGDIYERIFGSKVDRDAIDSPAMRATFDALRAIQQHTDPGSPNRKWNDTTNLVITGKALMQIQGDWMTGEFRAAGKKQGVDYDCMIIPGAKGIAVTTNVWGFVKTGNADQDAAELRFAAANFDPQVQFKFALAKGSAPVRLDVPRDGLPPWTVKVLDMLAQPGFAHNNPHITVDSDWLGAIWDVASKFWADPTMTDDQAIASLQKAYDSIF